MNIKPAKTKVKITCLYCGKQVERFLCGRKEVKYCSNDCSSKVLRGKNNGMFGKTREKHPCWKDEKKRAFNKGLRSLYDYNLWRTSVFKRDDFICQKCNFKKGGYLEAHHIIPLRVVLEKNNIETLEEAINCPLLWDVSNGVTLCVSCHGDIDEKRKQLNKSTMKENYCVQ
jgi:5-methylcytosine-specific restriction endonuclease McrA